MREILLRLIGVWSEEAGRITKISLGYHGDLPLWAAIILGAGLTAMVCWMYGRSAADLSPARRWTLSVLRSAALCLILVLLVHPIVAVTTAGSIRQTLLVMVDTSRSMQIADMRVDPADAKRAAIATGNLNPAKGLDQDLPQAKTPAIPRIELVKDVLKNNKLKLLPNLDRDFDLAVYGFDRDVRELSAPQARKEAPTTSVWELMASVLVVTAIVGVVIGLCLWILIKPRKLGLLITAGSAATFGLCVLWLIFLGHRREVLIHGTQTVAYDAQWIDHLAAVGNQTAIGDAVRDAILRKRGQPIAGVLIATDGGNNAGSLPAEAAKLAHEENIPIFAYGVGITSPRDIIVGNVFAANTAFVKDEVPVTVRVKGQGLSGQSAELVLRLDGQVVDRKEVKFEGDTEQVVSMKFTPERVGDHELVATIDPRPDEVVKDNNTASRHVRVIDGRIKVLMVEQLPRWEFKYLEAMLLRDRRVDAHFLLYDADPAIADLPNSPYVKTFPSTIKELSAYDLVILGDVNPQKLGAANMDNLGDFVSKFGGSLITIAGKSFMPGAYKGTSISKMLPVEFEFASRSPGMNGMSIGGSDSTRPIKVELTPAGKASPMLRLADSESESAADWASLPPIYWEARVARAKPAAEVLVVDPDPAKQTRFGKMPLIVLQQYGLGSVLYLGTDNTWRWRKNTGEYEHQRLWGQIMERMALLHLLGGSKRTQLSTDRENYSTGDRVTVFARLYSEQNLEPLTDATVQASYTAVGSTPSDSSAHDLTLHALPDQPGMYRGEFVAPAAGSYRLNVATDPKTPLNFSVSEQTLELGETALNVNLLTDMAQASGGQFLREEDLHQLPEKIQATAQPQYSTFEVQVAYSPAFFMLLTGLLGAEWTLRKLNQLK